MKRLDKNTITVVIVLALTAVVSFFDGSSSIEGSVQAWVFPLIGGLVSLGSSIASAAIGNNAAKKQAQAYDQAWSNYEDWYQGQINTNTLDRADSLSMMKAYRDWQDENNRKYQTNAIKGGASEEAKVAYAQQANKAYADVISRIAAQGQQYKDRLSQQYAQAQLEYQKGRADMAAAGTQAVTNAIANAGGIMGDMIAGMGRGSRGLLPPTSTTKSLTGVRPISADMLKIN